MEENSNKEKQAVLEKILKDKSRIVRVVPVEGYGHKLQTIYTNKVEK